MKKYISVSIIVVMCLTLLAGCGSKKSEESAPKATNAAVGMSADDVAKKAEKASYVSGEASAEDLYIASEVPFNEMDIYVQKHTEDEIAVLEMDGQFFAPVGPDYFYGEFTPGTTFLYSYDIMGDPVDVKGRIVYSSAEELKNANSDKELLEDQYNEEGYTCHGNVLYYHMPAEGVFAIERRINKFALLKTAVSGVWDKEGVVFFFSRPYEDVSGDVRDYSAIVKAEGNGDNPDNVVSIELSASDVYVLFTSMMKAKDMTSEEYRRFFTADVSDALIDQYMNIDYADINDYDHCEVYITTQVDNLAYAGILLYSIPENYKQGDKIKNYVFASTIGYDSASEQWKCAQSDETWKQIQADYMYSTLTDGCYSSACSGMFYKRFWLPFNLNDPVIFNGILYAKIIETYADEWGDLYATVYISNGTGEDVTVNSIENMAMACEDGILFEVSCDLYDTVPAGDYVYEILQIPADYLNFDSFSDLYEVSLELR